MPISRTEAELHSAIETMFRVRAVESPPDDQGARTIWHRGSKGADLVTWVDAFGRVTRQELYLFDDCLVWEKASGVRTGEAQAREGSKLNPSPGMIAFDPENDDDRLVRARRALGAYSGGDKFILHARHLVGGEVIEELEITRPAAMLNARAFESIRAAGMLEAERIVALQLANRSRWLAIGVGVLALLAAAAWWLFGSR